MLDDAQVFTVTDLKQFGYCPRILFYERCLPHVRPRTYKMDAGRDAHQDEQRRAVRRVLVGDPTLQGERFFNVAVQDTALGLHGSVDEVVRTASGSLIPVDYKLAQQASRHYKLQLAAYALLLEAKSGKPVTHGFLYLILTRKLVRVDITPALRETVRAMLVMMRTMIEQERMPEPPLERQRCAACEFRRFCNDV